MNGFTVTLTLWCGTCVFWEYMSHPRIREATAEAKSRGWIKKDGNWYCKTCAVKIKDSSNINLPSFPVTKY